MNNTEMLPLEVIRTRGLHALKEELGVNGMIRFLQQFEVGRGNYTDDRHQWLDGLTLEAIIEKLKVQAADDPS
jgi:hypothetical protein